MMPLSLAQNLVGAVVRSNIDDQYYFANELALDALARGARGPAPQMLEEDLIEEARRAA